MRKDTLFNKDFSLLLLGQTVSEIGNSAGSIALLWWVTTMTGSVVALGTLAMIRGIIAMMISPFAGAIVDRLDRKNIILLTDFMQGLVYLTLAYLAFTNQLNIVIVYVFGALATLIAQFFHPAIGAALPLIVPEKDLSRGNSLRQLSSSVVKIIGYAAGGIGIAVFGIPVLFLVNGVSFLISALSECFIVIPKIIAESKLPTASEIFVDIGIGFNYLRDNKTLLRLLKLVMVINMLLVPILLLMPVFVNDYMKAGSSVYGFILSGQMVGTLLGAILMSLVNINNRYPGLIKWGLAGMGLCLLVFPFLPHAFWQLHVIVSVLVGILNVIFNIAATTVLQQKTPKEHLGKILGFVSTLSNGLTPAAQGISGLLAQFLAIPIIYATSSIGVIFAGAKFAVTKDLIGWFINKEVSASRPVA